MKNSKKFFPNKKFSSKLFGLIYVLKLALSRKTNVAVINVGLMSKNLENRLVLAPLVKIGTKPQSESNGQFLFFCF